MAIIVYNVCTPNEKPWHRGRWSLVEHRCACVVGSSRRRRVMLISRTHFHGSSGAKVQAQCGEQARGPDEQRLTKTRREARRRRARAKRKRRNGSGEKSFLRRRVMKKYVYKNNNGTINTETHAYFPG